MKRPKGKPKRGQGYATRDDIFTAIIGQRGYVHEEQAGMLGVTYFGRTSLAKTAIVNSGGKVTQEGDEEIAGIVPPTGLDAMLQLIRVYRRPLRGAGRPFEPKPRDSG